MGDLAFEPTAMGRIAYMVDPRLAFQSKALGVVMAEAPPGRRSGAILITCLYRGKPSRSSHTKLPGCR